MFSVVCTQNDLLVDSKMFFSGIDIPRKEVGWGGDVVGAQGKMTSSQLLGHAQVQNVIPKLYESQII